MSDSNPVSIPIDTAQPLRKTAPDDALVSTTIYQQMIGSLMYLVTGSRPDLANTITYLSQFNTQPRETHFRAAKRVLRYLQKTEYQTLSYKLGSSLYLSCYSDASYGNCLDTRRSFSGYIFKLGSATISWRCRKQQSVAHSTFEAECMALALSTKQHIWTRSALQQLLGTVVAAVLFADSRSAIDLANNPKLNDASKHIDMAYHFTRERLEDGSLSLLHVPSLENLADICTCNNPTLVGIIMQQVTDYLLEDM